MVMLWDLLLWCFNAIATHVATSQSVTSQPIGAVVSINLNISLHVTNENFLSVGMAPHLIRHQFKAFDFTSPRVLTLAQGLSPAFMRFSGTDADRMIYVGDIRKHPNASVVPFPVAGFNMTTDDWDKINRFAIKVGWRMIYGVNGQIRAANGTNNTHWFSENAQEVLRHSILNGYANNTDFEFGNEPDLWFPSRRFTHVTPEQLGSDYCNFKSFLSNFTNKPFINSLTIGPDVTQTGLGYLERFLNNSVGCLNATSWHQYYGRGEDLNHPDNYTDPAILDRYVKQVKDFNGVIRQSNQTGIKVWQGETASTVSPPPNSTIGESYVSTFMLMDKLGVSAVHGIDVVVKQAFFGFWFSLIDNYFFPTPNYWVAYIFKRMVGRAVLDVKVKLNVSNNTPVRLRAYAHCASPRSGYPTGSVVIYAMNLYNVTLSLDFKQITRLGPIHQFLLSPWRNNLTSHNVALNGNILNIVDDETLPPLKPVILDPDSAAQLPSKTLAFYVILKSNTKACVIK